MPTYRFLNRTGWRLAGDNGIKSADASRVLQIGEAQLLDFDTAINLSREYFSKADEAEDRGDAEAEERWSTWAEELEIWAASYYPAPGRVIGIDRGSSPDRTFLVTRNVHHDDQAVSFAEMTRRN